MKDITPLPWYIAQAGDKVFIQSAAINEDNFVCEVEGRNKQEALNNAQLIVNAVNNN